jgi:hypothetical protein
LVKLVNRWLRAWGNEKSAAIAVSASLFATSTK